MESPVSNGETGANVMSIQPATTTAESELVQRLRSKAVQSNLDRIRRCLLDNGSLEIPPDVLCKSKRNQAMCDLPRVAYIAMPYRAKTEWELVLHIRAAERLALKYWRLGYAVICPHKNTAYFGGSAPDDVWLKGDLAFLARSDVIVMGPGWPLSSGATEEYNCAREWGIEVIFDDGR